MPLASIGRWPSGAPLVYIASHTAYGENLFDKVHKLGGSHQLELLDSPVPTTEVAFLLACSTAQPRDDADLVEGLHLATAMQCYEFRSVIGTMWAMYDGDGAELSRSFYRHMFSRREDDGIPLKERVAGSLRYAVQVLRQGLGKQREATALERWVNFVHMALEGSRVRFCRYPVRTTPIVSDVRVDIIPRVSIVRWMRGDIIPTVLTCTLGLVKCWVTCRSICSEECGCESLQTTAASESALHQHTATNPVYILLLKSPWLSRTFQLEGLGKGLCFQKRVTDNIGQSACHCWQCRSVYRP